MFPDDYPKTPDEKTEQHVISLESSIPDPYHVPGLNLEKNGLDQEVEKFILEKSEQLLHGLKALFQSIASGFFRNSEKEELRIFFGCKGGWQRSVFMAAYFEKWLNTMFGRLHKKCEIRVEHISMKRWEKKES
jgi:RNase adaptor protein for sRNA GlmZ degradation